MSRSRATAARTSATAPPAALARLRPAPRAVPGIVHDVLRAPGEPLAAPLRTHMESRFGRDLTGVRVHAGPRAAAAAESLGARAFAAGRSVVFGTGEYRPESGPGRRLLAHELAHVVQQGASAAAPTRLGAAGDPAEREARHAAEIVAAGGRAAVAPATAAPSVQCDEIPPNGFPTADEIMHRALMKSMGKDPNQPLFGDLLENVPGDRSLASRLNLNQSVPDLLGRPSPGSGVHLNLPHFDFPQDRFLLRTKLPASNVPASEQVQKVLSPTDEQPGPYEIPQPSSRPTPDPGVLVTPQSGTQPFPEILKKILNLGGSKIPESLFGKDRAAPIFDFSLDSQGKPQGGTLILKVPIKNP